MTPVEDCAEVFGQEAGVPRSLAGVSLSGVGPKHLGLLTLVRADPLLPKVGTSANAPAR
jgi:hypothetical protein